MYFFHVIGYFVLWPWIRYIYIPIVNVTFFYWTNNIFLANFTCFQFWVELVIVEPQSLPWRPFVFCFFFFFGTWKKIWGFVKNGILQIKKGKRYFAGKTPKKVITQLTFTCSKSTIGTLEKGVKYAQI